MAARGRSLGVWVVVSVGLVVGAMLMTRTSTNRDPLDPDSVAPDGARALVELVEAVGGHVRTGQVTAGPGDDVAVILRDGLTEDQRNRLGAWVRAGGRLVIVDPSSPWLPEIAGSLASPTERGRCAVPAFADVDVVVGLTVGFRGVSGEVCFGGGIAVGRLGNGVVIGVGGPEPLLNGQLADGDNAGLAVALLAPTAGIDVVFLTASPLGLDEPRTLTDLVADPVWVILGQVVVGFLLYAWFRARRLGRPVPDPPVAPIEGSELTGARGRLLADIGRPGAALHDLRLDARRLLLCRFGLPPETSDALLASRLADQGTISAEEALELLAGRSAANDRELHELAVGLGRLRSATGAASPADAPTPTPVSTPGEAP